jgi:hypothetical protein
MLIFSNGFDTSSHGLSPPAVVTAPASRADGWRRGPDRLCLAGPTSPAGTDQRADI